MLVERATKCWKSKEKKKQRKMKEKFVEKKCVQKFCQAKKKKYSNLSSAGGQLRLAVGKERERGQKREH